MITSLLFCQRTAKFCHRGLWYMFTSAINITLTFIVGICVRFSVWVYPSHPWNWSYSIPLGMAVLFGPNVQLFKKSLKRCSSKRAARIVAGNYKYKMSSLGSWNGNLSRKGISRRILLYKGLNDNANIPADDRISHSSFCRFRHLALEMKFYYKRTDCWPDC